MNTFKKFLIWGRHSIFWMTYELMFALLTIAMAVQDLYASSCIGFFTNLTLCILFLFLFTLEVKGWCK